MSDASTPFNQNSSPSAEALPPALPLAEARNTRAMESATVNMAFLPNCWSNSFFNFPGKSNTDEPFVWNAVVACTDGLKDNYVAYRFQRLTAEMYLADRAEVLETMQADGVPPATARKVLADFEKSADISIADSLKNNPAPAKRSGFVPG